MAQESAKDIDPSDAEHREVGEGLLEEEMALSSSMAHLYRGEIHRTRLVGDRSLARGRTHSRRSAATDWRVDGRQLRRRLSVLLRQRETSPVRLVEGPIDATVDPRVHGWS